MRTTDGETRGPRDRFANWAAAALLAAAAQFVVLTLTAMLLYTGGSAFDPAAGGYAFFHNYFSDLGMTETYDGAANWPALALFTYALVCVGVALAAFGFAVRRLARHDWRGRAAGSARGARAVAALAAARGHLSGASYVGIALTPHDIAGAAHLQFVNAAFGFLLVFVLCLGYLEVRPAGRAGSSSPTSSTPACSRSTSTCSSGGPPPRTSAASSSWSWRRR